MARYLVTGAARGIGGTLAAQLAKDGHEVVGLDRAAPERPEDFVSYISADLSSRAGVDAALASVTGAFDGLCNAAGLPPRSGNGALVLSVNVFGLRAFTLGMLDHLADGGAIVNLASRAGREWMQNVEQCRRLGALDFGDDVDAWLADEGADATRAYNMSKEVVILWTMAMTEPLRGRGLRMNSVSPGAVSTDILDDFKAAFGDKVSKNLARAGRPASAEEVAAICAFLLSPASHWIKGSDIPADGGMTADTLTDALNLAGLRGA